MWTVGFSVYWAGSARQIPDKGDLRDYWMGNSSARDFLGTAPSYTLIRDLILRLCHWLIACSIAGRSQAPEKVTVTNLFYLRGMDVGSVNVLYLLARLADHFGLLTAEILGGLTIIAHKLLVIDMAELPPPPPPAPARIIPYRLGRLEEDVQGLYRDVGSLRGLVERSMTDQGRFSTWMMTCMMQLIEASGLTYQAFDNSFRGISPTAFQRQTRQRTGKANTSTAQSDPQ
ncbi:hypothetical protein Tco_0226518 [Tanacetum coccineum]